MNENEHMELAKIPGTADWIKSKIHKEKVAEYKEGIEKQAQTKWRALIDSAKNPKELSNIYSEFNRNERTYGPMVINNTGLNNGSSNSMATYGLESLRKPSLKHLKINAKKAISKVNSEDRIQSTLPKNSKDIKRVLKYKTKDIEERKNAINPMDLKTSHNDPEEYLNIIHGTNRAKAKAFLHGGNAPSKTDVLMNTGKGNPTNMGIMVHTDVRNRAKYYANRTANNRGGEGVVVEGKIQRKYLYPNDADAGKGDEYSIPSIHHDKIKDVIIKHASDEDAMGADGKIPALEKAFQDPIEKKVAYMIATSHEYKKPNVEAALSFVKNYKWELGDCKLKNMQGINKPIDEAKVAEMVKNMKTTKPFIVVNQFHGIRPQTPGKKFLVDGHHRKICCERQGRESVPIYNGTYTGAAEKSSKELREKVAEYRDGIYKEASRKPRKYLTVKGLARYMKGTLKPGGPGIKEAIVKGINICK